jgi:hypothetical protein
LGFEEGKIEEICACVISSIVGTGSNMPYDCEIYPYAGVGKLRFGMNRKQVEDVLGLPDKAKRTMFRNETQEFRRESGLQTVYSASDEPLVEITFYGNQSVSFEDLDVFQNPGKDAIKRLAETDGKPFETVGIVVFIKLGIAMTGFLQDDEPGQKSISVFAKGRWNSEIEDLKPLKMKNK